MWKGTPWGKCGSCRDLEVLNQSFQSRVKFRENFCRERGGTKKRHGHNIEFWGLNWNQRGQNMVGSTLIWWQQSKLIIVATGRDFFLWHHLFLVTHPKFWQSGAMVSFIWPNLPLKHFRGPICRQKNQGVWFNLMWQNFLAESVLFRRLEQQTWKIFPHSLSSWTGVWSQST